VTAGVVGTYGTTVASGVTTLTATDTTGAAGLTYSYEVEAVGATGTGGADGTGPLSAPAQVTVPAASFVALPSAPVSLTTLVTPIGNTTDVTTGDVINTTFNQPIAVTAGATVTLANALTSPTDVAILSNGVNATFTVTGASLNVLSIKVTAPPSFSTGSVAAYPQIYTTATGVTGVVTSTGAGGFAWDLTAADGAGGTAVQGNEAVPSGADTIVAPRVITAASFNNTTPAPTIVVGNAGSALPGATVIVTDTTHAATGTAVAAANGSWSVTLTGASPTAADTLSATETIQQEGSGNGTSGATTVSAVG
jgi:hypothetical protein